ncbi:MAG: GDP-L-fucose synthase [Paludibacteraceae bacterium]|nr:GDP-L-fucose synthase [Paludibacteraceae bacterium]
MEIDSKIYVAGHRGMVGSAIVRELQRQGYTNIITRTHKELDLCRQEAVEAFFAAEKPEYVFLAAGHVGGIQANINSPAEFLYDNVMMQVNVIHQSHISHVKKIVILGSSCIYPTQCPQPMKEEYLMDGKLEPTNEGYALSKIVALRMGTYYKRQYGFNAISVMPPNLYGYNDSTDPLKSHVLSATVRKFLSAVHTGQDVVTMWGTGNARREFMHADDMAAACLYMMQHYDGEEFINIGWGTDVSIRELAEKVAAATGFKGRIEWDTTKPDGMMRKCMDVTRMRQIGFQPTITLEQGIAKMIEYYKNDIQ